MEEGLTKKTVSGVYWSAIERFSVQGIQFVIQIIMARLLLPSDYGIIGMLAIFLQISQVFIDSGFNDALIQKQNRTEKDLSTVFYFNILISLVIYVIIYLFAPCIASFYRMPELVEVTRFLFINLVLISFSAIHRTILTIKVDFKNQTKISLVSVVVSGIIGVYMAYRGLGVWALVVQSIMHSIFMTIFSYVYVKWRPHLCFSFNSFRQLFAFGSKLLLSRLINCIYRNLYTLVIGRKFTATDLGYFTRADQLATFPSYNINSIISRVTYPILSSIQDDDVRLKNAYRQYIRISSYIIFPLMLGLAALAEPVIRILLTDKWMGCVILLQILCLDWMLDHISQINMNLLLVKGHSDWALKLELIKKTIAVLILVSTIPFGIVAMCWGKVLYSIIATILNTRYTKTLISLSLFQQIKDVLPSLFLAGFVAFLVNICCSFILNDFLKIMVGLLVGSFFYIFLSIILKFNELKTLINILNIR